MIEGTFCNSFPLEGRCLGKQKLHATECAWFGFILALSSLAFEGRHIHSRYVGGPEETYTRYFVILNQTAVDAI